MLKLQYKDSQRSVWLVGPRMKIGRGKENDLIIDSDKVADFHAELLIEPNRLMVMVVGKNAVTVNGDRVTQTKDLLLGDELAIADRAFVLIDPKGENAIRKKDNAADFDVGGKVKKVISSGTGSGWMLQGSHKSLRNKRYPINGTVVLGRSNDCELNFTYDRLSRRHAEIKESNGILYVKDLNSSNGTFVNGKRVNESRIRPGDVLSFDKLSFTIIGPGSLDDDVMDEGDELNKTVIRPAIDAATINKAAKAAKSRSRQRLAEEAVEAMRTPVLKQEKDNSNTITFIALLLVLLGTAAVWLLIR